MTAGAANHALVTGGAGFLGSHLCEQLLSVGTRVSCVDNLCTSDGANVGHLIDRPGFEFIRHDVTQPLDAEPFRELFAEVDLVLHFASPASPADYLRLPVETLRVGSVGTWHALELARNAGARFVLASTSEAYGDPQVHPQPESYWGHVNPVGPRGVYDEAKRFGEAITMAYRTKYDVDTAIVRIFNTYGPRMRREDGRAIPTFITQALADQPVTVAGDGSQTRSVCYVDDTVRGILAVAGSDLAGPINVGNPQEMSISAIAEAVIAATGSASSITYIDRPVDDPSVRCPDISFIRRELGWWPAVSFERGLSTTIDWFARRPVSPESAPVSSESALQ